MHEQTLEPKKITTYEKFYDGFWFKVTVTSRHGNYQWTSVILFEGHICESSTGQGGTYEKKQAFELIEKIKNDYFKYGNHLEFKSFQKEYFT